MLTCQFQIFETKQSRSGNGNYEFFMCLKKKAEWILSGQDQGDAVSEILVSGWEYAELKIWCVFNTSILKSLRFGCFS